MEKNKINKSNSSMESRITRSKKEEFKTEWARVLKGYYKGDLAHIKSIDEVASIIYLVPRIDYITLENDFNNSSTKRRPNPRPFDIGQIRKKGGKVQCHSSGVCTWHGNEFSSSGLLKKSLPLCELQIIGVIPKAAEMKRFSDCSDKHTIVQADSAPSTQLQTAVKRFRVNASSSSAIDTSYNNNTSGLNSKSDISPKNPNKRHCSNTIVPTPKRRVPAIKRVPVNKLAMLTPPNLDRFSIVWVKVRGYKDWPGVIEEEIKGRYKIHFFGDYSTIIVTKKTVTNFYEGFGLFKHTFDDLKLKKAVQEACICMMRKAKTNPDHCLVCDIANKTVGNQRSIAMD